MAFTNFVLNAFSTILSYSTSDPDVTNIHSLIDRAANHASHNSNSPPMPSDGKQTSSEPSVIQSPTSTHDYSARNENSTDRNDNPKQIINVNATSKPGTILDDSDDDDEYHSAQEEEQADPSFLDDSQTNCPDVQFPDGDKTYRIHGDNHQIGWATLQYCYNKTKHGFSSYKKCLGVYECPDPDCEFRKRPRLPREKDRKIYSMARSPKVTHCKIHTSLMLVHKPCDVTMTVRMNTKEKYVEIEHKGSHGHVSPHTIHVSNARMREFRKEVRRDPKRPPISLMTGTENAEGVYKFHRAFVNIDRVRKLRRREMEDLALETPEEIAGFDRQTNTNFITTSSVRNEDGCIILQTDIMKKIMNTSKTASQTDTIEGFVMHPTLPNVNLTVTLTFCDVQKKWVPTQFGILFGKSMKHYEMYFYTLLQNMSFKDFDSFVEDFMGMVCDFSEAERLGFEGGLERRYNVKKGQYPSEKFYACCEIHFIRSASRVKQNHSIIPMQRAEEFWRRILRGQSCQPCQEQQVYWSLHRKDA